MDPMSHTKPHAAEGTPAAPDRASLDWASPDWARAHRAEIQMRYGDIDAMGHLNNAVYVQYLETSRVILMRELGVPDRDDRSVIARLELDYRREVLWGQTVAVESLVERVGRTSWTVVSRLTADGVPCAFARTVQVRVDAGHRPEVLPESLRAAFAPLLARPLGDVSG
ncbi:thioesterase superfamily protein [Deinococcus phoenicis]|uniref:Thioesterase superfamily protein n=1 Tax=Deinococcus phoenicis TaxID=1476583 RepID=A0A016QKC3_9DEIO|nr:thioesterase family protein [Deinococcus phoenicis]EYB66498.1 thioesterase superfamily protein [Deinococcus phoenicis]